MTKDAVDYVLRQASCRASVLVTTARFSRDEWADFRQEFILDYLRRARHFDANRGEWTKFVAGVMRNHSTVLFRRTRRSASKEVLTDDIEAYIPEQSHAALSCDLASSLELSMDVQRVIGMLPRPLSIVAIYLTHMSVGEISYRTRKSRSRIYQMIRQI